MTATALTPPMSRTATPVARPAVLAEIRPRAYATTASTAQGNRAGGVTSELRTPAMPPTRGAAAYTRPARTAAPYDVCPGSRSGRARKSLRTPS